MKRSTLLLSLLAASALAAPAAHAGAVLIAMGSVNGSAAGNQVDLSGLTGTLENGLPGNVLGGMGSGIAYAGNNSFLALPDRGPNATPYPDHIDDTVSYINRYQSVQMKLTPNAGPGLPFDLTTKLYKTTLLYSPTALDYGPGGAADGFESDGTTPVRAGAPSQNTASQFYFTGRSDNFDPAVSGTTGASGDPTAARFDTESIRVSNDGRQVFISDEYGPFVREFNERTGKLIKTFTLPTNLDVKNLSANSASEMAPFNTSGRVANKGMEGLAITPDGKTLVGIMQAALIQDAAVSANKKILRIVTIDIATGTTHEYGYKLTTGSGVSDIVALNDHQFLVDERDGTGLGSGTPNDPAIVKQLYLIDINGAQDITNLSESDLSHATLVTKSATPFLDVVGALGAAGIAATSVPSKIEGISFGEDVMQGGQSYHTLWVANDNDFTPADSGPNNFYVFAFKDSDLPTGYTFAPQHLLAGVPEPATWASMLLGFGVLGAMARRRARTVA
jgi:hypothetical protein